MITEALGEQGFATWLGETFDALSVQDSSWLDAVIDMNVPIATTNIDGVSENFTGWTPADLAPAGDMVRRFSR